jgi:hypothetical protein
MSSLPEFKLESTGMKHTKRVLRNGVVIGLAGQLSNNRWRPYGVNDVSLTLETFQTPNGVLKWFKAATRVDL